MLQVERRLVVQRPHYYTQSQRSRVHQAFASHSASEIQGKTDQGVLTSDNNNRYAKSYLMFSAQEVRLIRL